MFHRRTRKKTEIDERQIKDMEMGEVGYTVPWAVYLVKDRWYINHKHSVVPSSRGSASMRIRRVPFGVLVDQPTMNQCPDFYEPSQYKWLDDDLPVGVIKFEFDEEGERILKGK